MAGAVKADMGGAVRVVVRFRFEGVHSWPGAPPESPIGFLVHPHRHEFHVEASKSVAHDDREIEFITLKRDMESWARYMFGQRRHTKSCEMMARELVDRFKLDRCAVFEDGENGAEVTA